MKNTEAIEQSKEIKCKLSADWFSSNCARV